MSEPPRQKSELVSKSYIRSFLASRTNAQVSPKLIELFVRELEGKFRLMAEATINSWAEERQARHANASTPVVNAAHALEGGCFDRRPTNV